LYTKPYDSTTAVSDLGVPIRLSPDVNINVGRGTVQQTYAQIIQDLQNAAQLLTVTSTVKSRPNKVATFAMLARVYLSIGNYTKAGLYADSCLQLYNTLLNYGTLSATSSTTPFVRFNAEVIFSALTTSASPTLNPNIAKIDTSLYNSYATNDRRKAIFFNANSGANLGIYSYKGGYDGPPSSNSMFMGLATDEVYLIRSECYARAGYTALAMADLNTLMSNRWTGIFTPFVAVNADDALYQILTERRKELVFRALRWTDLRRLNKDSRFAKTLTRPMNTVAYTPLAPNDLRYAMLLPATVINTTGVQQNPR
jgi:hypothetical protein